LAEFGFFPFDQSGSHVRFRHIDGRQVTVPHHARKELQRGILMAICKKAGIDPDDFFSAFR
jgi:predicted RNA binding protein YcfA (HicA-like mRNA interferase family)